MNVLGYTESGMIRAEIEGTEMVVPDDMANRHRRMIAEWEAAGGKIPPFVPPPLPIPHAISDRQFFQQLAVMGLITQQEALDAVGPGIIPASMDALISELPSEEQFSARMLVRGATIFDRRHPLAGLIGSLYGLSEEQRDALWQAASQL